jgi:Domain of unknown function (DUF2017)
VGDDHEERLMATLDSNGDTIQLSLDEEEAHILRGLLRQMSNLLEIESHVDDAVIDRLFPSAYADPEDAKAFADLVGDELRSDKVAALGSMLETLGTEGPVKATLAADQIDLWLTGINDVRLALGTRLDVTEERMSEDLPPGHPAAAGLALLDWLAWIQDSLLETKLERGETGAR